MTNRRTSARMLRDAQRRQPRLAARRPGFVLRRKDADVIERGRHHFDRAAFAAEYARSARGTKAARNSATRSACGVLAFYRQRPLLPPQRTSSTAAWSTGTRIPELEITTDIASPTITNNAATIYFHANPTRDIYVAHRNPNGSFTTPTAVSELNTAARDACPFVLQNDDYMNFDRAGDIFESTR